MQWNPGLALAILRYLSNESNDHAWVPIPKISSVLPVRVEDQIGICEVRGYLETNIRPSPSGSVLVLRGPTRRGYTELGKLRDLRS